jgi:hypothetical protein
MLTPNPEKPRPSPRSQSNCGEILTEGGCDTEDGCLAILTPARDTAGAALSWIVENRAERHFFDFSRNPHPLGQHRLVGCAAESPKCRGKSMRRLEAACSFTIVS